jgi:hypothetical protein
MVARKARGLSHGAENSQRWPKRIQLRLSTVEDFAIEEPAFRKLTKWGAQRASDFRARSRSTVSKIGNMIGSTAGDG